MKARWHFWYDVDGCGETVLALTPLKDTKHAEKKQSEILNALKIKKGIDQWVTFFKKHPKDTWNGKDIGDLLGHEIGKHTDFTKDLQKMRNKK